MKDAPAPSKVELAKEGSNFLRGTVEQTLADPTTSGFAGDDLQVLKFHGIYQQENRDLRRQATEKTHTFMIRAAIPAGILTARQYLQLDAIAERYGNANLRVTTRQGLQYHGVLKGDMKATIAAMNEELVTTLAACGDIERNLMACPAPAGAVHRMVQELAREIARDLQPASRAYHEIWLDEEKIVSTEPEEEPFYGERYLPRKFKAGIAIDTDNCVDIYTYDGGLIALTDGNIVRGFNLVVGGGQGMTHNKPDTFAALAQPLGFVPVEHAVEAMRTVVAVFRDFGNRSDRRHARLKYLLAEWGIERFRQEFQERVTWKLGDPVELPRAEAHDHLGKQPQGDGNFYYGLFIQSGRLEGAYRAAVRQIVTELQPGVRLTGQQNLLLTDLTQEGVERLEVLLRAAGVALPHELSGAVRHSMACPALPTCGLALAESERAIPEVLRELEAVLTHLGLRDVPVSVRMTGCPNGCARPYTADVAFVGRSLGLYNVYVGGRFAGDRLSDLFAADVKQSELVEVLKPLLMRWRWERQVGEGLGDFYQRLHGDRPARQTLTGKEQVVA